MIEDMRIHGMGDKTQKAHIRAIHCPAVAACSDEREGFCQVSGEVSGYGHA